MSYVIFYTSTFSVESQPRTSCFLALLRQPGAHSLLPLCDPVSVRPGAVRLCGAGCTIRCPQNEMGCFITSPSGSCLPGIHIPAKEDTWPSCASVHQKTAAALLCRGIGGETRSILSGTEGSTRDGKMPGVHFTLSA